METDKWKVRDGHYIITERFAVPVFDALGRPNALGARNLVHLHNGEDLESALADAEVEVAPTVGVEMLLNSDGACEPNPGRGSYGFVAVRNGQEVFRARTDIGYATNNEAEWQGAVAALAYASREASHSVVLRMDSMLVVNQLNGRWRVKEPRLRPFWDTARALVDDMRARGVTVQVTWVPREQNEVADALANGRSM